MLGREPALLRSRTGTVKGVSKVIHSKDTGDKVASLVTASQQYATKFLIPRMPRNLMCRKFYLVKLFIFRRHKLGGNCQPLRSGRRGSSRPPPFATPGGYCLIYSTRIPPQFGLNFTGKFPGTPCEKLCLSAANTLPRNFNYLDCRC